MRLIDADKLIDYFYYGINDRPIIDGCNDRKIIDIIEDQPTAYDVDKVVEQIELLSENAENNDLNTYDEKAAYNTAYSKSIEIVKAGGIEYGVNP